MDSSRAVKEGLFKGKKTNEFRNTALTQLEKQPPDILTRIQALGTFKTLDNVRIPYAYGCDVTSIKPPTGVSVLSFGGVLASKVVCRTQDAKLYSEIYQNYHHGCEEVSRERPNTISNCTPSVADVMHVDCESRKLKSTDVAGVSQAYSALCSRGLRNTGPSTSHSGRNTCGNLDVSLTTSEATSSRDVRNTGPSTSHAGTYSRGIGGRRSNFIHDDDVCNTGPSTSRTGRNARGNPDVSLTTGEATCLRGIRGRLSVNVHRTTTVCSFNFIHDNDVRNTSRGGRNKRVNPEVGLPTARQPARAVLLGVVQMRHFAGIHNSDLDPQMVEGLVHFLDAYNELVQLFRTSRDKCRELDIPEFKIRLYNGQGARGYEFPTSNTLGNGVVCPVFEQKIQSFVTFHKEERIFGNVAEVLYIVEFQKRGLPHCHTLLWVDSDSKIKRAEDVDQYISAELPDPRIDLDGYNIVFEMMIHGPCGAANMKASCMKGDKYENSRQELIYVYGHSGTGKTFLRKTIISGICSQGKIVLAVASSGIAYLLLPSGRIAHSRFKLPLELTEESLCKITKNTHLGKLLADIDLIIWEGALMNDHCCFEALDRSLRDIVNKPFSLYGSKSVPLGKFIGYHKAAQQKRILKIHLGSTFLLATASLLMNKAIVYPKNETADIINSEVLDMVPGESTIYLIQDEATPTENDGAETEMLYPVEHLNTLKLPAFPLHHLELKVGA
uniref:ATP-dependent DNA helicase n=1 Tax=Tanacetum cinerariifolium TaxID=118510 RepID=A0A6L2LCR6_TANCI|nr:DNA helicase [Tanacetum cinerariifolium]